MNHKLKDDAAQFLVDYPGYYMTKRGYHPRAVNSGHLFNNVLSRLQMHELRKSPVAKCFTPVMPT
ncbi:hypothetical protein EO013_21935 [Escherichia coli]|nr:hypothetical protein [Escherichia coli]EFN6784917.1 hypothetical protein [Escherichia coli]EFN6806165.1 hypothetical protein [Escherichia coli]EFN6875631.1 hypothetical protein [Escherichia coli]EFN6886568.1 hypothetical protein [Escherichia coli]